MGTKVCLVIRCVSVCILAECGAAAEAESGAFDANFRLHHSPVHGVAECLGRLLLHCAWLQGLANQMVTHPIF